MFEGTHEYIHDTKYLTPVLHEENNLQFSSEQSMIGISVMKNKYT